MQIKEGCLLGLLRCLPLNQRLAFILNVLYEIPVEETSDIDISNNEEVFRYNMKKVPLFIHLPNDYWWINEN